MSARSAEKHFPAHYSTTFTYVHVVAKKSPSAIFVEVIPCVAPVAGNSQTEESTEFNIKVERF